jgi:hypothetical protein
MRADLTGLITLTYHPASVELHNDKLLLTLQSLIERVNLLEGGTADGHGSMTSMMQLLEEKLDRGLRDVRFELAETRLKVEATEHQIAKLEKEATGSGATTVKAAIEKAEEQRKAQETQLATVREAIDQQRLEQQTQHDKLSQQVAANRAAIDVLTMEMAAQAASAAKSIEHDVAELRQRVDEQEANMANQWREMARQMIDGDQYVKKNDLLSLSDEMVQLQRVVSHSHEQVCNRRTHRPTPCGRHRRVPLVCPGVRRPSIARRLQMDRKIGEVYIRLATLGHKKQRLRVTFGESADELAKATVDMDDLDRQLLEAHAAASTAHPMRTQPPRRASSRMHARARGRRTRVRRCKQCA